MKRERREQELRRHCYHLLKTIQRMEARYCHAEDFEIDGYIAEWAEGAERVSACLEHIEALLGDDRERETFDYARQSVREG